jgi:hypothetical protein
MIFSGIRVLSYCRLTLSPSQYRRPPYLRSQIPNGPCRTQTADKFDLRSSPPASLSTPKCWTTRRPRSAALSGGCCPSKAKCCTACIRGRRYSSCSMRPSRNRRRTSANCRCRASYCCSPTRRRRSQIRKNQSAKSVSCTTAASCCAARRACRPIARFSPACRGICRKARWEGPQVLRIERAEEQ